MFLRTEPDQPHQYYIHKTHLLRMMLFFFERYGFFSSFLSGYFYTFFGWFLFFTVTQCHSQGCEAGALTTESVTKPAPGSSCSKDLTLCISVQLRNMEMGKDWEDSRGERTTNTIALLGKLMSVTFPLTGGIAWKSPHPGEAIRSPCSLNVVPITQGLRESLLA